MLFAYDHNDNRIFIEDTHSNSEYYCPYCGAPLITKKGEIRQHHFAHKLHHLCSDSWEREHTYDISPWHNEWQNKFPKENQEIKLVFGDTHHRADVMIGRTVVEFQHSIMPVKFFDERNNFYHNLGYKVIWLFDLSPLYEEGQLNKEKTNDGYVFYWKNPKKAFNNYDVKSGCIDLFLQLKDNENKSIIQVRDVSECGFEQFETSEWMNKADFLEYVGLCNGNCEPPYREDVITNQKFLAFKQKYGIQLNKQQERALQAVDGANLLLAVPGSGKTTVLVARLGYMVKEKGISPNKILALTFNHRAAEEMKTRYNKTFGTSEGESIDFRTLNSLCNYIYISYCKRNNHPIRKLDEGKIISRIISKIYNDLHPNEYATESDVLELKTAFAYIKNMMLKGEDILSLEIDMPKISEAYKRYQKALKENNLMDFDDQMVFAYWILKNNPTVLQGYQKRYQYICVDEAQDTSKIQHKILQLLFTKNIFMVGDEDQSIYGFRAAFPKALLNFRYDYRNPFILRMERNYRSTSKIVDAAQSFISKNSGRYEKNMVAERNDGEDISLITVNTRAEQFKKLIDIAKETTGETAFLYRDNDSAVVLVDAFLRNKTPFVHRKPEMNFFGNKIVKDIVDYLTLSLNPYDADAFERICNKGLIYLKANPKKYTVANSKRRHITVFEALEEQMQYIKMNYRWRVEEFENIMTSLKNSTTAKAIEIICEEGYSKYAREQHYDLGKIEILKMLAENEPKAENFLAHLKYLEAEFVKGFDTNHSNPIVLSTIHSSKGLEYNTVYMVDVYDDRFPSSRPNFFSRSKDNSDGEQEERRLFYVGITRAKNKLYLFNIKTRYSSYLAELFPSEVAPRQSTFPTVTVNFTSMPQFNQSQSLVELKRQRELEYEKRRKEAEEAKKKQFETCYNEVKDKFNQQEDRILDHTGQRWVKCEECGEIKPDYDFASCGGVDHVNLGICSSCSRKRR